MFEQRLFLITVACAFTLSLCEFAVGRVANREAYGLHQMSITLLDFAVAGMIRLFLKVGFAVPILIFAFNHRLIHEQKLTADSVALLMLGIEFLYYWRHRAMHGVHWFWATHSVHHSVTELNFIAAFRLGVTGRLSGSEIFYLPLCLLGYDPEAVVVAGTTIQLYQFWLHSERIPKLGILEHILNTPSLHRVHHARNDEYIDCNFGGVFIFLDKLFGTYRVQLDNTPIAYGLRGYITPTRFGAVEIQGWKNLFARLRCAENAVDAVRALFGKP